MLATIALEPNVMQLHLQWPKPVDLSWFFSPLSTPCSSTFHKQFFGEPNKALSQRLEFDMHLVVPQPFQGQNIALSPTL